MKNNFNFNSLFLNLFQFKKILDGRNIHLCYLPLLWNHRSRKRSVAFLSYRWWFEKIRFLVSGIICMWQAWSVSIIYGGNHSITLGAVQSAPRWAASLMPGVQSNAERLARDNMLSEYSEQITVLFFLEADIKEFNSSHKQKGKQTKRGIKNMRVFSLCFESASFKYMKIGRSCIFLMIVCVLFLYMKDKEQTGLLWKQDLLGLVKYQSLFKKCHSISSLCPGLWQMATGEKKTTSFSSLLISAGGWTHLA